MLMAINSGNTNAVFALFEGEKKRFVWRAATDGRRTADEYAVWLTQLMALEGIKRTDVSGAIVANVVPQAEFNLKQLCRRYFGCEPMVIGDKSVKLGVKVLLDRPEEAGADRLLNAVAAGRRYKMPAIVVDLGTATTFDCMDKDGSYLGGAISPGINLSMEALHMGTAKLPRVAVRKPDMVIGRGTIPAMQSGVFWGYIGLIEGLVSRIQAEHGTKMSVIATGGLAPLFAEATKIFDHIDVDLTLAGLADVYRLNTQAA
jgi:type III pantothenate kinase